MIVSGLLSRKTDSGNLFIQQNENEYMVVPRDILFYSEIPQGLSFRDIEKMKASARGLKANNENLFSDILSDLKEFSVKKVIQDHIKVVSNTSNRFLHEYGLFSYILGNPSYFDIHQPLRKLEGDDVKYLRRSSEELDFIRMLQEEGKSSDINFLNFISKLIKILRFRTEAEYSFNASDMDFIKALKICSLSKNRPLSADYINFTRRVLSRVGHQYHSNRIDLAAKELLINLGIWRSWDNLELAFKNDTLSVWNNFSIEQDRVVNMNVAPVTFVPNGRYDFGNLPVYTIDSESTKDVDDGISIERCSDGKSIIHVHIAEPSSYIDPTSTLFKNILKFPSSQYFIGRTVNMLPEDIIRLSSIEPDKENNVLTVSFSMDESGAIDDKIDLRLATVSNVKKITYKAADAALKNSNLFKIPLMDEKWLYKSYKREEVNHIPNNLNAVDLDNLQVLNHFAFSHASRRLTTGLKILSIPNLSFNFNYQSKFPEELFSKPRFSEDLDQISYEVQLPEGSSMVVQEFMIIACALIAKFTRTRNIPCLYSVQEGYPSENHSGNGIYLDIKDSLNMLSKLKAATFDLRAGMHMSSGLNEYAQVTSPIRRGNDLINHMQIINYINSGRPYFSEVELKEMLDPLESKIRLSRKLSNLDNQHWKMEYLKQNGLYETFKGYVLGSGDVPGFYRVFLKEIALITYVKAENLIRPGELLIGKWINIGCEYHSKRKTIIFMEV